MGVEPFLTGAAVTGVLAQRLARRLCEHCRQAYEPSGEELEKLSLPSEVAQLWRPGSCNRCNRGYRGRIGIFQLLPMSDDVRRLAARDATGEEIAAAAHAAGMRSLWDDGLEKVTGGLTTIDELRRVLI
jgi:type IV pilus assembly protein PilB